MSLYELQSRIEHYFAFNKKEVGHLLIAILVVGFIFSFRDWGRAGQLDLLFGLRNFLLATLIAAISFFVHESVHRIFALWIGFKVEFKLWWGGLIASIVLAFASNGAIQLILPGGMVSSLLVRHRLGVFRYGLNYWENGVIAMTGPLANLTLAFVAKLFLSYAPNSWFLQKLLLLNIVFAICTMLPIPPLDGINTFYGGRILYILSFSGIIGASILIYFTGIVLTIIGGLLIMIIATILYYMTFEAK